MDREGLCVRERNSKKKRTERTEKQDGRREWGHQIQAWMQQIIGG